MKMGVFTKLEKLLHIVFVGSYLYPYILDYFVFSQIKRMLLNYSKIKESGFCGMTSWKSGIFLLLMLSEF